MLCLCIACPTLTTSEKSVKTDFSLKNASNAFRPHCATQSFALPKFVLQQLQRNNKKDLESTTKVKFQYEPSGPSGQRFSSVLLLPPGCMDGGYRRVTRFIKTACTHLYTLAVKRTVRVNCLTSLSFQDDRKYQEVNWARLKTIKILLMELKDHVAKCDGEIEPH